MTKIEQFDPEHMPEDVERVESVYYVLRGKTRRRFTTREGEKPLKAKDYSIDPGDWIVRDADETVYRVKLTEPL